MSNVDKRHLLGLVAIVVANKYKSVAVVGHTECEFYERATFMAIW